MRLKLHFRLRLALLSLFCLASLRWTFAAVTSAAEPVTAQVERMCYVEKSKVDELIVQMNSTVRVLNRDDEYLECGEKLKIVEADNMEICTEERIRRVQKDLFEVAGSLFKLAVRLTEPSPEEVRSLDLKKIRLIHDLYALHVFYGPSPCDSHSIALFPFASLVEHLEWNLAQILVLFQTPRPTRPPPPTTPAPSTTTSEPTVEDMLNPEMSLSELAEMAELNPSAMSKAVPQIISQRYNERASTFDKLLTFALGLPTEDNRVFGLAAIYDEMHRYIREPEFLKLAKLEESVKRLNESASTASNFADTTAQDKLLDLIRDLSPITAAMATTSAPTTTTAKPKPSFDELISPEKSFSELIQMAQSNPSVMTKAIPQIVSRRYNEQSSTFDKLLSFVHGLPTTENKIFGFAAIHDEMYRYKRNPDVRQLLKLKEILNSLNDSSESASQNSGGSAANLKLADVIQDLSSVQTTSTTQKPIFDRMLSPEISFAELTEMAKSDPFAMAKAIPQIISQRYNERNSTFNALLTFVQGLPTIENQVFGFAAVYDEMHRYIRDPEFSKLAKLAESVERLNEAASTSLNFTGTTTHHKLVDLIHDLSPITAAMATTSAPTPTTAKPKPGLEDMLDPDKSFADLIELAKLNPSLMSRALPKIVSQRYSRRVSTFDSLLDFVNAMPTIENKIFGFSAVYDEMHGYNQKPEKLQLEKLAENVRLVIASAPTTLTVVARSKLDELAEDPDLRQPIFMLSSEKSLQELTEWAKSNPRKMSIVLPQIISQRYNASDSQFDALLDFVDGLPTTEDKIIGLSSIYDEMRRHSQQPGTLHLTKLAKHVKHIIDSAPTALNVVARSKLDEMTEDPDLYPMVFLLSPEKTLQEFTKCSQSNPSLMSIVLPQIISQRYNASDSQFEALLNFVDGLPTTENKIIGFVAIHDQMHRHDRTTNLAQLLKLAKKVKILNEEDQASSTSLSTVTELKWTNLIRELRPVMLIGEKADCHVTNVAYGTGLTFNDYDSPQSVYVYHDQSSKATLQIYPAIQNFKLVFRILYDNCPVFASDTNTNSYDTKYQTKTSERYVLWDGRSRLPTNAENNWKLLSVPNKANQFKILSAKSDDFMFAHKSATGIHGWRRVLLGRKSYTEHDHIPNADLWTFECKPGTFYISSI